MTEEKIILLLPALFFFLSLPDLLFFMSCSGLSRTSKKHKALAHDMHAESNALRQRFVPQPVLRSSWQQLVMFRLVPDISLIDPRNALRLPENDRRKNNTVIAGLIFLFVIAGLVFLFVIAGLDPAIYKHKALAHDMHAESNALRQRFVPQPVLRSRASPCQAGNSLSCFCTVFGEMDKKLIMDTPVKICYSITLI